MTCYFCLINEWRNTAKQVFVCGNTCLTMHNKQNTSQWIKKSYHKRLTIINAFEDAYIIFKGLFFPTLSCFWSFTTVSSWFLELIILIHSIHSNTYFRSLKLEYHNMSFQITVSYLWLNLTCINFVSRILFKFCTTTQLQYLQINFMMRTHCWYSTIIIFSGW